MTIEQRCIKLKHLITCMKCEASGKECDENCPTQYAAGNMGEIIENLEAISEILEQQPCEDCISRQAVLEEINKVGVKGFETYNDYSQLFDFVDTLPPATPKEKTGHWIRQTDDHHDYYECEHCGIAVGLDDIKNYCPNCGARMEVEE